MCQDTLCQHFSKLNALLVKAVDVPQESLEHHLILKMSKKRSQRSRCQLISNDNAGRTSSLKILVSVLVLFSAGEGDNLRRDIGTELLLAGGVLNDDIRAGLALPEAYKLKRNDGLSLMQKLIEGMLSVCSGLSEDNRPCHIGNRIAEAVDGFSV